MSATAYYLKKILKWQYRKIKTAVMEMRKEEKCLWLFFLKVLYRTL